VPAPASPPATAATAANPSAPAIPAEAPAAAAPAVDAAAASADAGLTITLPNIHGKGRKLQTAHHLPIVSALFSGMQKSQPAVVSVI
jgi:hypothetical protein